MPKNVVWLKILKTKSLLNLHILHYSRLVRVVVVFVVFLVQSCVFLIYFREHFKFFNVTKRPVTRNAITEYAHGAIEIIRNAFNVGRTFYSSIVLQPYIYCLIGRQVNKIGCFCVSFYFNGPCRSLREVKMQLCDGSDNQRIRN